MQSQLEWDIKGYPAHYSLFENTEHIMQHNWRLSSTGCQQACMHAKNCILSKALWPVWIHWWHLWWTHSLLSVNNETSWISDPTTEQEAVCLTHIFKPFTSLSSLCEVCPQSAMACLVPNSTVENSHHFIWETPVCRLISEQLCTTISAGSPPLCDCYQKASSGLACHSGLERKEEGGGGGHTGSFDAVLTSVTAGIVPAAAHTVTTLSPHALHSQAAAPRPRQDTEDSQKWLFLTQFHLHSSSSPCLHVGTQAS